MVPYAEIFGKLKGIKAHIRTEHGSLRNTQEITQLAGAATNFKDADKIRGLFIKEPGKDILTGFLY